jgi:hypothetical protein
MELGDLDSLADSLEVDADDASVTEARRSVAGAGDTVAGAGVSWAWGAVAVAGVRVSTAAAAAATAAAAGGLLLDDDGLELFKELGVDVGALVRLVATGGYLAVAATTCSADAAEATSAEILGRPLVSVSRGWLGQDESCHSDDHTLRFLTYKGRISFLFSFLSLFEFFIFPIMRDRCANLFSIHRFQSLKVSSLYCFT